MKTIKYYIRIPDTVMHDVYLSPNAKLLYGEISSQTDARGICYCDNDVFAKLYNVSKTSISKWISELVKHGYIERKYLYKSNIRKVNRRILIILK